MAFNPLRKNQTPSPSHEDLSEAMLSLARALHESPPLDPVSVAEIAKIMTDAQLELRKLTTDERRSRD